jgi:hypothetical protein
MAAIALDRMADNIPQLDIGKELQELFGMDDFMKHSAEIYAAITGVETYFDEATVIAIETESGERIPLAISGGADIGDRLMLVPYRDYKCSLGIVVCDDLRKGIFGYPTSKVPDGSYIPYKFLL